MFPVVLELLGSYMHVFVDILYVLTRIEVGSAENIAELLNQCGMELWNITHVLDVVLVDPVIVEDRLKEVSNHLLDNRIAPNNLVVILPTHPQKN